MNLKVFLIAALVGGLFLINGRLVYAVDAPDFPACSNPQGVLKVTYDAGVHGIVGRTASYEGSDQVYLLDNSNLLQCFCSIDGAGIQTEWWKIGSLDREQIETLKSLGWYYVPTGAVWGLEDTAYMAKNSDYACGSSNGGSSSSSGGGSSSSDSGVGGGGVLGWASTGNKQLIYGLGGLGLVTMAAGVALREKITS
jgi:hypothetical protein